MKASAAVTAVAGGLALGSLAILAGLALEFVGAVSICRNTGQPMSVLITPRVAALGFLPAIFGFLGLAAAVGLLCVREWARKTTLFLALAPLIVYLPIVILRPAIIFPPETGGSFLVVGDLAYALCVYSLVLMSPLSLWWIILLTRKEVRSQFP